jgi:hypothetical protein
MVYDDTNIPGPLGRIDVFREADLGHRFVKMRRKWLREPTTCLGCGTSFGTPPSKPPAWVITELRTSPTRVMRLFGALCGACPADAAVLHRIAAGLGKDLGVELIVAEAVLHRRGGQA